jgi:hypothetical protein
MSAPVVIEIEPWPTLHPMVTSLDLEMPFRPTMDAIAFYIASGDWVMLYNAVTLAVSPTFSE